MTTATAPAERTTVEEAAVVRSPTDFVRLVVATVALATFAMVAWLFGDAVAGFALDLLRGLDALGETFVTVVAALGRAAAMVVIGGGLVLAMLGGRWRPLLTVAVASVIAIVLFLVIVGVGEDSERPLLVLRQSAGPLTDTWFPTGPGLAALAAAVTAAAPWQRPWGRRLGWAAVLVLAVTRFVAEPVSGDSLAAVLTGWWGGAAALALLGAPTRRASREAVVQGLSTVGVEVVTLEPASVDARGSTPYFGETADGTRLFVKVLARGERDADLLFRLYRSLRRNLGDERPFSSLRRAVEHEALLSLSASQLGIRTPRFLALADAEPGAYVMAYEGIAGRSLDRLEPVEVTDDVLNQIWSQLGVLRGHRVAHRDLRLANLFLNDSGEVLLIDFGFSELAASDLLLATDLAELVASLSLQVGPERAVSGVPRGSIDTEEWATALPRLRLKYLSGATRTALKTRSGLLDQVIGAVASAAHPVVAP